MQGLRQGWQVALVLGLGLLDASSALAGDGYTSADSGRFDVSVGGFAIVTPKYEGSSSYEVYGFPIVLPSSIGSDGWLQVKGVDDIRFKLFDHQGFEAGPLAGWRFDRDEDDGRLLRGLGDVDGGLVVGGYVAYRLGMVKPFLSYHHQVTGDETGGVLRFGTEAKWELGRGVEVVGSVGASWADDDYMDAYFSVSPAQAAASVAGLPVYQADSGIKDVFVGATAKVPLSDLWTLYLTSRYEHLVGDAADSPLIESEHQWTGGVGLTYKLNLR